MTIDPKVSVEAGFSRTTASEHGGNAATGRQHVDPSTAKDRSAAAPEPATGRNALDPISVGFIDHDADGPVNPQRSHMPEADRRPYEAAIARVEDFQDREVAAQIADSEQYRSWLRRQGFDVPEPPTWNEADDNSSSPVPAGELAKDAQRHDSDQPSNSRTHAANVPAAQEPSVVTRPSTVGPVPSSATAVKGRTRAELARLMRGEE